MTSERIGILGGTFDPVHFGHLILGKTARDEISLDRVLFIPTGHSWRKQQLDISPWSDRLAMARLATEGTPLNRTSVGEILAEARSRRLLAHPEPQASTSPTWTSKGNPALSTRSTSVLPSGPVCENQLVSESSFA